MPGDKYLKQPLKTREDVIQFFDYLIKDEKTNFHPDDNFETYINLSTERPTFEKSKAIALNARMDEAKKITGNSIYDLAQASVDKNYAQIKSVGESINMKPRTMFGSGGTLKTNSIMERVKVFITGYPWWLEKIDHTHLFLSNNEESKGNAMHVNQLIKRNSLTDNEFYKDVTQWLNGTLDIADKQYGEFAHGGAVGLPAISKVETGLLLDTFPVNGDGVAFIYIYEDDKYQVVKWGDGTVSMSGPNILLFDKDSSLPYDPVYEAEKADALDFVPEEDRWMAKGGMFDQLSVDEKQLLEILNKKNKAVVDSIERIHTLNSGEKEYNFYYSGTYKTSSGFTYPFRAWLPLSAIRDLVDWSKPEIAAMSDYPQMVNAGDWSGIRDTNRLSLWKIFDKYVLKNYSSKKEAGGEVEEPTVIPYGEEQCREFLRKNYGTVGVDGVGITKTKLRAEQPLESLRLECVCQNYYNAVIKARKNKNRVEPILRKHFQKTNREGLGFLETNIKGCAKDLEQLASGGKITDEMILNEAKLALAEVDDLLSRLYAERDFEITTAKLAGTKADISDINKRIQLYDQLKTYAEKIYGKYQKDKHESGGALNSKELRVFTKNCEELIGWVKANGIPSITKVELGNSPDKIFEFMMNSRLQSIKQRPELLQEAQKIDKDNILLLKDINVNVNYDILKKRLMSVSHKKFADDAAYILSGDLDKILWRSQQKPGREIIADEVIAHIKANPKYANAYAEEILK